MLTTEFKAGEKAINATQLGNGDLVIEGYAARFKSTDREGEQWAPGAFTRSIAKNSIPLCWHHQKTVVLGAVLSLDERSEGLWMRARVDAAIKEDPQRRVIFEQIKAGTLSQLSVGGYFRRSGSTLVEADIVEVSVTPAPVDPATWFLVTEGKALGGDAARQALALLAVSVRMAKLDAMLDRLDHATRH